MSTLTAFICNYNHGALIGRALEAMLTQSRPPDELIVLDDGSTDDSVPVIESWAARFPIIRFLRNERNLGLHASATKSLAAATGDYVYNGSADDSVLPGFFEAVCDLLDRCPSAGLGCAKLVTATPDGARLKSDGYPAIAEPRCLSPREYRRLCLDPMPPTHSLSASTIYRRARLNDVGGWRPELGPWYDTFAIRAIGLRWGVCYVPIDGATWYVMPAGLSQTLLRNPLGSLRMVRRAAALMRSAEFRETFPPDYVSHWEAAYVEAIVLQPLQPAIDGYQAIQQVCRRTAEESTWPVRLGLGILRRLTTACYLALHHVQKRAIRRRLQAEEAATEPEGR